MLNGSYKKAAFSSKDGTIEQVRGSVGAIVMVFNIGGSGMDMKIKETLPEFNGRSAYSGALRFFDPDDLSWQEDWGKSYGPLLPQIRIFASDAFGVMYGFDRTGQVVIFWAENGEIEELGIDEETFYSLIKEDPEETINWGLYKEAVRKLGNVPLNEDLAFKIELALGGKLDVNNLKEWTQLCICKH